MILVCRGVRAGHTNWRIGDPLLAVYDKDYESLRPTTTRCQRVIDDDRKPRQLYEARLRRATMSNLLGQFLETAAP